MDCVMHSLVTLQLHRICVLIYSCFLPYFPPLSLFLFICLFIRLFIIFSRLFQLEKKSVLDTEIEAKAFLEVMGKKMHSEGYREPEAD